MQLRDDFERFQAAGVGIVAIGQGSPARTREFSAEMELPYPLLGDPRRSAYRAYGLTHARLRAEINPGSLGRHLRATVAHGAVRETEQDMLQLGGVFVIDQNGRIRFAFRQRSMSDVPANDALLNAIR